MHIPKQITIGGHDVRVFIDPTLEERDRCHGCFDIDTMTIYIQEGMPQSHMEEVFLHEVIEAANIFYELDMKHRVIQTLGVVMQQVFGGVL